MQPTRWEFQDGMRWIPMDASVNLVLNAGPRTGTFSFGSFSYSFDLDAMTQKNNSTGVVRSLRISSDATSSRTAVPCLTHPSKKLKYTDSERTSTTLFRNVSVPISSDATCSICLDSLSESDAVEPIGCSGHHFHAECLAKCVHGSGLKCPLCGRPCGVLVGTQPSGTMEIVHRTRGVQPLSGHEDSGTLEITYVFPSGQQLGHHPSPGQPYSGTVRTAYLPDTPEGLSTLSMLETCFLRGLTFTIGTSVTTGLSNCVVWNGVHHKTSVAGGAARFGFPDETYFSRVKLELAAKGITPSSM